MEFRRATNREDHGTASPAAVGEPVLAAAEAQASHRSFAVRHAIAHSSRRTVPLTILVVFVAEGLIMLVLPLVAPGISYLAEAALDSLLLATTLIPFVLWMDRRRVSAEVGREAVIRDQSRGELRLFRTLLDRANETIEVIDPETARYLDVNERACVGSGFTRDELLGMTVCDIDPSISPASFADYVVRLRTEGTLRVESSHRRKDGSTFPVEVGVSLVQIDREYLVAVVRDVTDRKLLESQFLQAQKMEAVGRLAGGIAHDFNNLLMVILGTLDLAEHRVAASDRIAADLRLIRDAADRAASLTRQLLAFSRKQVVEPRVLELGAAVLGMEPMLHRLIGEDVRLGFEVEPHGCAVSADPGQVEQILLNLVVNARDAMPDGGTLTIEVHAVDLDSASARARPSTQPGPYVRFSIRDTGTGMDEATRLRVFEPFFTTKQVGKGTGLGLSTVYGIVQQSRGSISAQSEVGRGTTFEMHFPRVAAPVAGPAASLPAQLSNGKETVLLVEDEVLVREVEERVLREAGYEVIAVESGADALRVLDGRTEPVHLLLTDVVMPTMNGRELADRVRAVRPEVRVLFTSGYSSDIISRHGLLEAGLHFIAKPCSAQQLTRTVRQILDADLPQARTPVSAMGADLP